MYGHVTTNSDRQVFTQVTLDVMSVRKPFRRAPALKRQGVTIIFNHDYYRIIFRNETVILVSHYCHSYLHVRPADGTPSRNATVMARALRTPERPTDSARLLHNTIPRLVPFCVASRARSSPHRRVVVKKKADTLPKFQADYMLIRSVAERERTNAAMHHVCGNTQWSDDQLHVRKERWIRRLDTINSASLRILRFPQSGDFAMRQRDEYQRRVQECCT